jgi:hypothetical protein
MKLVSLTIDQRMLKQAKKRAKQLFGHRGLSRYIRHTVALDLKRQVHR